jgi:hypothetical protein
VSFYNSIYSKHFGHHLGSIFCPCKPMNEPEN